MGELPPLSVAPFPHLSIEHTSQAVLRITLDHTCNAVRTVPVTQPLAHIRTLLSFKDIFKYHLLMLGWGRQEDQLNLGGDLGSSSDPAAY